jgi:hypothetical protein
MALNHAYEFFQEPPMAEQKIVVPPPSAHPKIRSLYDYWRKMAPDIATLPGRKHIDPTDIPKLLEHIWMLDVVGEPPRFRVRLLGGAGQRKGFPARVGDFMDQFFAKGIEDDALDDLRFIVACRQPVWRRGLPLMQHKTEVAELERLLLPLAADGKTVDIVLCITMFYSFAGESI